jgi:proteasome assembly chaperone (PAC2) family protein
LLELLVKKYGFKVNMDEIEKEAKNIEKAFTQLQKQFEDEEPEDSADKLSYVR